MSHSITKYPNLIDLLGNKEVSIQEHIDIYYLAREMPASEKTALESVMEADEERCRLEKLAEQLSLDESDESQDYLMEVTFINLFSNTLLWP